jgi:hypothetical protein
MSYPSLLVDKQPSSNFVTFSVPNRRVVRKIELDSDVEEHLHIQVCAKALSGKVQELAVLFSKFDLEASPIEGRNEIRVRLFVPNLPPSRPLPSPPSLPPNSSFPPVAPTYVVHAPGRAPTIESCLPGTGYLGTDLLSRTRLTTIDEEEEDEDEKDGKDRRTET